MSLLTWFRPGALCDAIRARYADSGAARYGMPREAFEQTVTAVVERYAADSGADEQIALLASLHLEELVLARACAAGDQPAWNELLARYRAELYRAAAHIVGNEAAGRELADELYAELYGLPNGEGRRVSKLDYYMGRGSLGGWLRSVLAQKHVDRRRATAREVSLEEQTERGAVFAAPNGAVAASAAGEAITEALRESLQECSPDERFLLASYFLDGRTLAQVGRQLGWHESTISRKLDRVTRELRKRVRKRLMARGMSPPECDEVLAELDVRDLNLDVGANLRQEKEVKTFQE